MWAGKILFIYLGIAITMKGKEVMNLRERKEGTMEELEKEKEVEKMV